MNAEHTKQMGVEDNIDSALKLLGETEPPAELVSHVHHRLEAAVLSQRARSGRQLLIPAAGVAMATLACFAIFIQMHRAPEIRRSAETAKLVATVPLEQATPVPPGVPGSTKTVGEGKRPVQRAAMRRFRRNHREYRHTVNLLSYPLTQQEKLLVRFVQSAKPADLQALNREYQAKVEAEQEAEFAAYLKSGTRSDTESARQTTELTQE